MSGDLVLDVLIILIFYDIVMNIHYYILFFNRVCYLINPKCNYINIQLVNRI